MTAPLYTLDILRLAANPPAERIAAPDGQAERRSPACGSRISTFVRLDADGRVAELAQQTQACAFGQASAALVGRHGEGRSLDEVEAARTRLAAWLAGDGDDPGWPGFAALSPVRTRTGRHGAVLLPFDALAAAIRDALSRRSGGSARG